MLQNFSMLVYDMQTHLTTKDPSYNYFECAGSVALPFVFRSHLDTIFCVIDRRHTPKPYLNLLHQRIERFTSADGAEFNKTVQIISDTHLKDI